GGGAPASLSVTLLYTFIFVALTAWVAIRGINKGIELANRILMPALFIILFGLIFYSLTLPNAWAGLTFYLVPDFGELKLQTIFNGLKQSFFSLSLGTGTLLIFGSYLSKKENVISSSVVIALADTSVAFLAGLMIFPFVFSQNMSPAEGPPLVFLVLPKVFFSLGPVWGKIMGALFFLLLCFAALTSTISLIEGPTGYLVDRWKASRSKAVLAIAAATLVLSIPSVLSQGAFPLFSHLGFYQSRDFLTFISDLCDISLVVWGGLMCVVISQRWTTAKLDDELSLGNSGYRSSWLKSYLRVTLTVVCPLILAMLVILIVYDKFVGL
ncbi:MAG: sodium-dependent transporter, partial [Cytophagales bacterium]|nr:sodium-dependent transporter [Cytophagales bacterium]